MTWIIFYSCFLLYFVVYSVVMAKKGRIGWVVFGVVFVIFEIVCISWQVSKLTLEKHEQTTVVTSMYPAEEGVDIYVQFSGEVVTAEKNIEVQMTTVGDTIVINGKNQFVRNLSLEKRAKNQFAQ